MGGHAEKTPIYYIEKLRGGPVALSMSLLLAMKNAFTNANSEWISNFLFLDGLEALENATLAYEMPNV